MLVQFRVPSGTCLFHNEKTMHKCELGSYISGIPPLRAVCGWSDNEPLEYQKLDEFQLLSRVVLDILSSFLGVALDSLIDLKQFDDVLVVEGLQGIDLGLDKLVKLRVLLQNLDGISGVGVVLGKLDFAGDSTAEFPTQSVLS